VFLVRYKYGASIAIAMTAHNKIFFNMSGNILILKIIKFCLLNIFVRKNVTVNDINYGEYVDIY
jgi:hypothetical protein